MKPSSRSVIPFRIHPKVGLHLPFTAAPNLRAAQISALPEFAAVQPFGRERWNKLQTFQPNVLVGYGLDLQNLCANIRRGEMALTSVDHAIFALTDCGSATISDALRVTLWQSFGVPVYELIIAPGCRLLAAECEAHDGWHMAEGNFAHLLHGELVFDTASLKKVHTGMLGRIDTQSCECGRNSARVRNLAPCLTGFYEYPLAAVA